MSRYVFEIDPQPLDLRQDRKTWSAVSMLAFALIVAAGYRLGWLSLYYSGRIPNLGDAVGWESLDFWLRTVSGWSKFLAAVGLLTLSREGSRLRRAGLFLICTMIDLALWLVDSAPELGFKPEELPLLAWLVPMDWLRYGIGTSVGWSEFTLLAGMVAEIGEPYEFPEGPRAASSIRKITAVGMSVWMLFYLMGTRWVGPGAPAPRRLTVESFLLMQAGRLIWTICLLRLTAAATALMFRIGRVIADRLAAERSSDDDPFGF